MNSIRAINDLMGFQWTCLRGDGSKPLGKGFSFNARPDINYMKQDLKPYKEMMAKYGVPYMGGKFKTDRMKLMQGLQRVNAIKSTAEDHYETWLGIRFGEPK